VEEPKTKTMGENKSNGKKGKKRNKEEREEEGTKIHLSSLGKP
jgi:hypothetical protein